MDIFSVECLMSLFVIYFSAFFLNATCVCFTKRCLCVCVCVCVCVCACVCEREREEEGRGDNVCGHFRCIILLTGVAFCWAVDLA